ncbi:DUF4412 domain-containing protein [Acetobacter pomorum]|uniref:DUF4412 domain-containing protein n=2 Tax=Acetobacter pomorum TaxID=65959 RepID=A0A2G4RA71_9PROT|nr:DUF4412 domain-containing protein [Acetobacter pomorum]GBR50589.1 hypothetical protein AA11825_1710 [Acetobacter pomorum DSM 11825]
MDEIMSTRLYGRMRFFCLMGVLGAAMPMLGATLPGRAQAQVALDHPRLTPARDAIIDYSFQPQPTAQDLQNGAKPDTPTPTRHVQVMFSGDGGLMRINYMTNMEGDESRGAVIINRASQEVLVILNDRHIYTRLVQQEGIRNPFLLDLSMQFTRKGSDVVAGQPCTVWAAQSAQGQATACVTDDGFILSQTGIDVDGLNGRIRAMKVSYEPVPDSVFQPPVGFQEVNPHSGAKGGGGAADASPAQPAAPAGVGPMVPAPATGSAEGTP